jgi:hypothetical protein
MITFERHLESLEEAEVARSEIRRTWWLGVRIWFFAEERCTAREM